MTDQTVASRRRSWLRLIVYGHLAAVVLTAFSMSFNSYALGWPWQPILEFSSILGFIAWFACPIAFLVCFVSSSLSLWKRLLILAIEGAIASTHLLALLPAVQ